MKEPEIKQQNLLQRLDIAIRTAREAQPPEGPPSPQQFIMQVLGKLAIAPQDVRDIPQLPKVLAKLFDHVAKDPVGVAKYIAENPPAPSTIGALLAPGITTAAYRNVVPMSGRLYIHNYLQLPGEFSRVTSKERQLLKEGAETSIAEKMVEVKSGFLTAARRAEGKHNIRFGSDKDVTDKFIRQVEIGSINPNDVPKKFSKKFQDTGQIRYLAENIPIETKRKLLLKDLNEYYNSLGLRAPYTYDPYIKEAQIPARAVYLKASGNKQPPGFYSRTNSQFNEALGKHYIEPKMQDGKIVPKAIHDVYKFFPEVYDYGMNSREAFTKLIQNIKRFHETLDISPPSSKIQQLTDALRSTIEDAKDMSATSDIGRLARIMAFNKRPTIVNIPLDETARLNTIDRINALMSAQAVTKRE